MSWDIPDRTKRNRSAIDIRPTERGTNRTPVESPASAAAANSVGSKLSTNGHRKVPKSDTIVITRRQLRRYIQIGAIGLGVILMIFLAWQYIDARQDAAKLSDPKTSAEQANQELVSDLRKVALLPTDEDPQVAELTDKEKQKNNPFFANAENGDKVLVYQKASKVIIYRPSTKQVVNMATIDGTNTSVSQ